jgi:RNA polymerase sigma factor for flagellar operon FliA
MTASESVRTTQWLQTDERDNLILERLPQVRLIARRIHSKLPGSVSLDDLVSAGITGLIAAIDRYDPAQGVKLQTYAEHKIRGAILDSLRSLDWAPRPQRKRWKQLEAAANALEQSLRRTPTDEEAANYLNLSLDQYYDWKAGVRCLGLSRFEAPGADDDHSLMRFVADNQEHWPSNLLERSELGRVVAEAIRQMPEIERTVLNLYYYDEMTLREIASIVGLHESRISQLKTQALNKLRCYMEGCWPKEHGAPDKTHRSRVM